MIHHNYNRAHMINTTTRYNKVKKQEVPDGLYQACPSCNSTIRTLDLMNHLQVCPQCGHHLFIDAYARLDALFDHGKYKEYYTSMKSGNPLGFPGYEEKLIGDI